MSFLKSKINKIFNKIGYIPKEQPTLFYYPEVKTFESEFDILPFHCKYNYNMMEMYEGVNESQKEYIRRKLIYKLFRSAEDLVQFEESLEGITATLNLVKNKN